MPMPSIASTMRTTRSPRVSITALAVSMLLPCAAYAQSAPPDGLYRIDMVGSMATSRTSVTQGTDGTTGDVDVEQSAGGERHAARFAGSGQQTVCLRKGAPPAALAALRCANLQTQSGATGGSVHAACPSMDVQLSWRRIDARTWEATSTVTQDLAATSHASADARAALSMASAQGTRAQRAQAKAAMAGVPQQAQIDAAQAQLRATMEAQLRNASPEEAAQLRQMIAAMGGGSAATQLQSHAVQRYTRIADTCTP